MRYDIDPRALIDDLLELTVVGSFSRVGPTVRRRLFAWTPPSANALAGRTVLVTGPTSGLGRQVTDELAAVGARVILVGRKRGAIDDRPRCPRRPPRRGSVSDRRRRHGLARVGPCSGRRDPGDRVPPRRPHRQRRRHLPGADDRPGRHRGDARDAGGRAIRPDRRPAAAARRNPGLARHRRDLRWAIRPGDRRRRPRRRRRRLRRDARLRPGQARPGHAHPRVGASSRAGRDPVRLDAPGLGRHARPGRGVARLRPADGTAPPDARAKARTR